MNASFASFECNLPNASCSLRVEGEEALQPTALVKTARDACWHSQFDYAPINKEAIKKLAGKPIKNFNEMVDELATIKTRSLKKELEQFTNIPKEYNGKGDFRDFAASYYLYCKFTPAFNIQVPKQKTTTKGVRLIANTPDWKIVKKAILRSKPEETMSGLTGIFYSTNRKLGEFNGLTLWDTTILVKDNFKRKSFSSLLPYIDALPELNDAAREYAILKGFEASGTAPFITIETVNKCYPQFKLRKPKGKKPKK